MKKISLVACILVLTTNCKTLEPISGNASTQTPPPAILTPPISPSETTETLPVPTVDLSFVAEEFRGFVPEVSSRDFFLDYTGFVLEFDTLTRNVKWVCYLLCRENLGNGEERASNFRMERRLGDYSPRDAAYRNSGFDRGHLAPAADMGYSAESMYDSFFLTNASPQVPGFNRGIWKRLEDQVRKFAADKDSIYVATGPILQANLPAMGDSPIRIPEYFYKVILKKDTENPQGIAFIMKNESASGDLKAFAVSIDSVEVLTGINFFPLLSPLQESKAEGKFDVGFWFDN